MTLAGGDGLLKTTDGAKTWQALPTNLSFGALTYFKGTLFALAATPAPFAPFALLKSDDGGQKWNVVEGVGGPYSSLSHLFTDGNNLYVGVEYGVASSSDGIHWSSKPDLLPGSVQGFAGVGGEVFTGAGNMIDKTSDGGQTWFPVTSPTQGNWEVTALGSLGDTLFAGIYLCCDTPSLPTIAKSSDGGRTWGSVSIGSVVSVFGQAGQSVLAGLQNGSLLRTDDGGLTWVDSSTGLPVRSYVYAFAPSGSSVLVGTSSGVYASDDVGRSWTPRRKGFDRPAVSLLATSGDVLFAETQVTPAQDTLQRSSDGGSTWEDTGIGYVYELTSAGDLIYAATTGDYVKAQLDRSTDGGVNWTVQDVPFFPNGLVLSRGTVFASTSSGIFSSSDGSQWASATGNLPNPYVYLLLGTVDGLLVQLTDGELFRSTDGGATWNGIAITVEQSGAFFLPPQNAPNAVYAWGFDGLFQSHDGGATWTKFGDAAPPGVIRNLTEFRGEIFATCDHLSDNPAALYHMGVFALRQGGSWVQVNDGLLSLDVSALAVLGDNLFAGAAGVQKFQNGRSALPVSPALPTVPAPINVGHRAGPSP